MKYNKAQITLGVSIMGIIAVIVGVAMLPVFTSLIDDAQDLKSVAIEQVTNTGFNQSFSLNNDDLIPGATTVINGTCITDAGCATSPNGTLREDIEFAINTKAGLLTLINRTGTWNVSYQFKPDTYVDSATGRTVIKQVTLMFAVGLLVAIVIVSGIAISNK